MYEYDTKEMLRARKTIDKNDECRTAIKVAVLYTAEQIIKKMTDNDQDHTIKIDPSRFSSDIAKEVAQNCIHKLLYGDLL